MDWFTGIVVFVLIWWVAIFMVLPFGLQRDENGTPKIPHLKKKAIQITVLSAIIWGVVYMLISSDIISFREMAAHMGGV